jgi:hypothetical protein
MKRVCDHGSQSCLLLEGIAGHMKNNKTPFIKGLTVPNIMVYGMNLSITHL